MAALQIVFTFEEIPQPPDQAQTRRERIKAILRRYRPVLTPDAEAPTLDIQIPQEGRRD